MEFNQDHNGWDSLYLENHDQPRILGRWASDGVHRDVSAKMLALFHATGRGTLFLYQGQEIGMVNPSTWSLEELRDLEEIQYCESQIGKGESLEEALKQVQRIGRDNSRTPMQWNREANAGFTDGTPWIKVNDDYGEWNVETQLATQEDSVLGFWKDLLLLRKKHRGLVHGTFRMIDWENEQVYAYTRTDDSAQYLVVCSFNQEEVVWHSPVETGRVLMGNYASTEGDEERVLNLKPFEGRLYYLLRT